jgi:hypothetical protein
MTYLSLLIKRDGCTLYSNVVNPDLEPDLDPAGSETFSRIWIREKTFRSRIRAAPDLKRISNKTTMKN